MKIKNKSNVRIIGIESHGLDDSLLGVYIRFSKNSVSRSREVAPEVFADFDRHGAIVGLEFSNPGDYDIDAMQHVSEVVNVPQLRGIAVSRLPVDIQEDSAVLA